jgi:two-component system, sensor histidine kinase and response regulator
VPTLIDPLVPQGSIMVVDDNPENLKLLEEMLREDGYEVRSFPRGRLALAAADQEPPDLILLDINMPEMNGYEVCGQLKATRELADIPVIFLSALHETEDKVKAFRSGAVDYISKPFQFEEVQARVETHLKLHELRRQLKLQNERLEEAVAARTRELAEANERLTILDSSKNDFLSLISHEFRTPLNGVLGISEIILDEMPATAENRELREMFGQSRQRILSILDDALLLTQIDVNGGRFLPVPVSLDTALKRAVERTAALAEARRVTLSLPSAGAGFVLADEDLLVRALHALLETAVKFCADGETVRVSREAAPDVSSVIIDSQGWTIPRAALPKFFDLFSISESSTPGGDLGFGPPVAYRILAFLGASVRVANQEAGIRLIVSLRMAGSKSAAVCVPHR